MKRPAHIFLTLLGLAAIFFAVATPVLCELDSCCGDADDCCTTDCVAICCVAAVCVEPYSGPEHMNVASHDFALPALSLPQGVLPLPERPPIAAC